MAIFQRSGDMERHLRARDARVSELTEKYNANTITELECAEFKRDFPQRWADAYKVKRDHEASVALAALVEECTAAPDRDMGVMGMLHRNNRLLAAILVKMSEEK